MHSHLFLKCLPPLRERESLIDQQPVGPLSRVQASPLDVLCRVPRPFSALLLVPPGCGHLLKVDVCWWCLLCLPSSLLQPPWSLPTHMASHSRSAIFCCFYPHVHIFEKLFCCLYFSENISFVGHPPDPIFCMTWKGKIQKQTSAMFL